jgi:hypothetical protein
VYVAVEMALWKKPFAAAMALIVVVTLSVIGFVYGVESVEGGLPSVV